MENIEFKERFIDEKTGIEYIRKGDYYIPNLVMPPRKNIRIGRYGRMRARFLKENKKAEYSIMMIDNTLQNHLIEVDETAKARFDLLMKQFAEKENITEELKAKNQMEWVQKMNNIRNSVDEIIMKELIFI